MIVEVGDPELVPKCFHREGDTSIGANLGYGDSRG